MTDTDPPGDDITRWSRVLTALDTATSDLRAAAEHLDADHPFAGYHAAIVDAANQVARLRRDLLQRLRQHDRCVYGWGACPDHGATLATDGTRSWCTAAGCRRVWGYDRLESPCLEPATTLAHHAPICAGHARSTPGGPDGGVRRRGYRHNGCGDAAPG